MGQIAYPASIENQRFFDLDVNGSQKFSATLAEKMAENNRPFFPKMKVIIPDRENAFRRQKRSGCAAAPNLFLASRA